MVKTKEKKKKKKTKAASKKRKEIPIEHPKAKSDRKINPHTGSRFNPNTAQQLALDLVVKNIEKGKTDVEIRKVLSSVNKENGDSCNLDGGYLYFVIATHPEYIVGYDDGKFKLKKKFKPDAALAKKRNEKHEEQVKRAKAARRDLKKKKSKKK